MSRSVGSETAKIGDFVCEISGENFGKDFSFVPIMVKESASLMYSADKPPRKMPNDVEPKDGMPLCFSKDLIRNKDGVLCRECPYGENWNTWDKDGKGKSIPPKCKTSIDIFCIPEGSTKVALFQLRKTSFKAGQDLVNKIANSGQAPFMKKYCVKTKDEVNDAGQRYKAIDPIGTSSAKLTEEELLPYVDTIKGFLLAQANNSIDYDVTDSQEEQEPTDSIPF